MQKNKLTIVTPQQILEHANAVISANSRVGGPQYITVPSLKQRATMLTGRPALSFVKSEVRK